ncbi:hypothetical protein ACFXI5_36565, partial [Streptomyces niveus]
MSQQGDRPATTDDWWGRLYDESARDTGPAGTPDDTIDDRFDSAADTLGGGDDLPSTRTYGHAVDAIAVDDDEDDAGDDEDEGVGPASRPPAWWESPGGRPVTRTPAPATESAPAPAPESAPAPAPEPSVPTPAPVAPAPLTPRPRAPWEPPPAAFDPTDPAADPTPPPAPPPAAPRDPRAADPRPPAPA